MSDKWKYRLSGALGGFAGGLFGGGGGMVTVPLLTGWCRLPPKAAFANCVAVIWPVCAVSAAVYLLGDGGDFSWGLAAPYLLGGLAGGLAGGRVFGGVSVPWLRRIFGVFLLYGAARYLL